MPGPKFILIWAGFPSGPLMYSVGMNQDETPGPVAIAAQTSSGEPGTSTSTCTERRPEASFFTLMGSPVVSGQRLVVSDQWSVISGQERQLSVAISGKLSVLALHYHSSLT